MVIFYRTKGAREKIGIKQKTPRPGFEPGSKAPEASRMSTTLPRHYVNHVHGDLRFHTNNIVKGIKGLEQPKMMTGEIRIVLL